MTRIVTRLFDTYAAAEGAVAELERMGIPRRDISLIVSNSDKAHDHRGPRKAGDEAAAHDVGAGGVLAGLGMAAIPGLGPVAAVGWLASVAAGALAGAAVGGAAGGLVGALTHAGVSFEDAQVYAEGVRRGGSLVSVMVANDRAMAVESALGNSGPVDVATRGRAYRERGWRLVDEHAAPFIGADLAGARARHEAR